MNTVYTFRRCKCRGSWYRLHCLLCLSLRPLFGIVNLNVFPRRLLFSLSLFIHLLDIRVTVAWDKMGFGSPGTGATNYKPSP